MYEHLRFRQQKNCISVKAARHHKATNGVIKYRLVSVAKKNPLFEEEDFVIAQSLIMPLPQKWIISHFGIFWGILKHSDSVLARKRQNSHQKIAKIAIWHIFTKPIKMEVVEGQILCGKLVSQ